MKKNGFTIAELLTAMAIIGVVAAVCVPILQDKMPNKEALMFRKAYYLTERVVSELVNDEDLYPETGAANAASLANISKVQYNGDDYGADTIVNLAGGWGVRIFNARNSNDAKRKFCGLFRAKLNANSTGDINTICNDSGNGFNFATTDGISWKIPETNFSSGYTTIVVDVNGDKGENCGYDASRSTADGLAFSDACTEQPDRFKINVYYDGRIAAAGLMENEYLQKKNTTRGAKFETIPLNSDGSINASQAKTAQSTMNTDLKTFSDKYIANDTEWGLQLKSVATATPAISTQKQVSADSLLKNVSTQKMRDDF